MTINICNKALMSSVKSNGDISRDIPISIFLELFLIQNRYMKFIGFWLFVSNCKPDKCGFEAIKRSNP